MNIVPVYDEARVAEHFSQLKERQIAGDSAFASGFLEAWLTGVGRRAAFDDAFQQALYQGAHRQIVVPRGATKIKTGGQATIWRDGDRVYRVRHLRSEEEKRVFLEGTKMLRDLQEIVARRETGSDHVFEVLEMGLARDGHDAVQVYRWVPGEDLSTREHSLAAEAVIEIGIKLSRAVELLHRHNIVHRDICPRNVVLDNLSDSRSLRPVLIDFGFARLATTPMKTAIVGEHLAPEVKQPLPQWSKAADVYGLGSTLRWLLHPASAAKIEPVLRLATAEATSNRVSIGQFLHELTALSEAERLDAKRDEYWSSIVRAVGVDRSKPWFSEQLQKSQGELLGLAMGFQPTPIGRFAALSSFVNQIMESCPPGGVSLKQLRGPRSTKTSDPITTLWALRNHHVHAVDAGYEENRATISRFKKMGAQRQRKHFLEGVRVIGTKCALGSLRGVVDCVLGLT